MESKKPKSAKITNQRLQRVPYIYIFLVHMQRVYALPIAKNDTATYSPVFVTVSVQGCLTEADSSLILAQHNTAEPGWFGRVMQHWQRLEAVPNDDPTHWKAKLRKTVASKSDQDHLLHTVDAATVEIAHPSHLSPSAIQRMIHELTSNNVSEATSVMAAGLLPLSVAGAAIIPFVGKFILAGNLFHFFDSARAVKGALWVLCTWWIAYGFSSSWLLLSHTQAKR